MIRELIFEHPFLTGVLAYLAVYLVTVLLKYTMYLIQTVRFGYTEDSDAYARKHLCPECPYRKMHEDDNKDSSCEHTKEVKEDNHPTK